MLAAFYIVLGTLVCMADNVLPSEATAQAQERAQDLAVVSMKN